MRSLASSVLAAVAVALLATACGSPADSSAEQEASGLRTALANRDGEAACALLAASTRRELERSSGKACATAVLEESLPVGHGAAQVRVFGTMAQVRYDGDTMFLSRYDVGWRVTAAGCTPTPAGIYDCVLTGG